MSTFTIVNAITGVATRFVGSFRESINECVRLAQEDAQRWHVCIDDEMIAYANTDGTTWVSEEWEFLA